MDNFHSHTFLSDGVLSPAELIYRCEAKGYRTIAITDHAASATLGRVIEECRRDADLCRPRCKVTPIVGVELTYVPPEDIAEVAARAKAAGAQLVVVHGETPVEPVPPGTNAAAAACPDVDILAHPGLLTVEEARAARENEVFVEITARAGHSLGNGRVVQVVREVGGRWVLNTDAHGPSDLIDDELAMRVLRGAGLCDDELARVLEESPQELRRRAGVM
jgi:putative hydrolase